jgi:1,4-alpha-glucan branching enzyme
MPFYDADWNDDFHHALHVAVTGEVAGHYTPFADDPWAHTARALAAGYLRPGAPSIAKDAPPSSDLPTTAFVHFIHNHDQVGNRAMGDRLQAILDPAVYRALIEILVLSPQIPLFFQGDDHLATRPFRFFADYEGEIRAAIWKHRIVEAENFGGLRDGIGPAYLPDPCAPESFSDCKLDWREAEGPKAKEWRRFLSTLFAVRMREIVPLLGPDCRGGHVVEAPEQCLYVDWPCGDRVLKLRANLSSRSVPLEPIGGRVVYASGPVSSDARLDSCSIRVSLGSAA